MNNLGLSVYYHDSAAVLIRDGESVVVAQEESPSGACYARYHEQPEANDAGTVRLVGADHNEIVNEVEQLLADKEPYEGMLHAHNRPAAIQDNLCSASIEMM